MDKERRDRFVAYFESKLKSDRQELMRRTGYSKGRITQLLDENEPFGELVATRLAERLRLPETYFLMDAPSSVIQAVAVRAHDDDEDLGEDYVQIPEHTVTFSAGPGRIPIVEEIQDSTLATYRREWFQKQGIKPESARRFQVRGDSMEPLLHSGDTVLVNLAEVTILDGKVYALRYGDELRIKRVYKRLDGGIILHSDNPAHRPQDEEIDPESVQEHISIIGRVRDKSGSGGL
jgi:SOS-response transcriptional repressor LexA